MLPDLLSVYCAPALGAPGQPGRIAVLAVEIHRAEPLPDDGDPAFIFVLVGRIDPHPSMEAPVAGVDDRRDSLGLLPRDEVPGSS